MPDFKNLVVSNVTLSVDVESMNIGFLFSKTVLAFARFVFVFVNLLLNSVCQLVY